MNLMERFPDLLGREVTAVIDDNSGLGISLDGGWSIGIENPYSYDLRPDEKGVGLAALVGHRLVAIDTSPETAELKFSDEARLTVDLRDDAFAGPEAMQLYGPNNVIVVWN